MLDEIKARLVNLQNVRTADRDEAIEIAKQNMIDYNNDVTYLLSIIEQKDAELTKATEIIKFQVDRNDRQRKNYFEQEAIILRVEKDLDEIIERDSSNPEVGYICIMARRAKQAIRG